MSGRPRFERIAFFGTPDFAVPSLAALDAAGRRPLAVVSQPARRAGRGGRLVEPPVARWAIGQGVELLQPERVRDEEFLGRLRALDPDLAVVAAYGRIFPPRAARAAGPGLPERPRLPAARVPGCVADPGRDRERRKARPGSPRW